MSSTYDLIVVGSGPAALFFLHRYLRGAPAGLRVLLLEKGIERDHAWQLAQGPGGLARASAGAATYQTDSTRQGGKTKKGKKKEKRWKFAIALGGGSNLWRGAAPRMLPEDFKISSTYGVGRDWPLGYDDLEPYYCDAEEIMQIAGDSIHTPFSRSRPYPRPPHPFTDPEAILAASDPKLFFHLPCARPSQPTPARAACCASGVCTLCPVDAKFTILNEMRSTLDDPRVEVRLGAAVQSVETAAGVATGVTFIQAPRLDGQSSQDRGDLGGHEEYAQAPLVVLAANAIFNAHILLRSNLGEGGVGQGIYEPASLQAIVDLDGVDNYQSTTSTTGHGYALYSGEHRRHRAAVLLETWNAPPRLRIDPGLTGRWRQVMRVQLLLEDLPSPENSVILDPAHPTRPIVQFGSRSSYLRRAQRRARGDLEVALAALPVERIRLSGRLRRTEGHILGTTPMGADLRQGVVDRDLIHHRLRNLLILGGSVFPTSGPANSTLTIAALSLLAATRLGRGSP